MSIGITRESCPGKAGRNVVEVLLVIFLLAAALEFTAGFNFDQRAPLVFTGPPGSLFGYSVAQHRDGNTDWVLIGAPKASTDQPDVVEGGAVYKCPVAPLGSQLDCEQVPFDTTGHGAATNKSHQFFGATVESAGPDGRIVACAPKLVWYPDETQPEREREPTGVCFVGSSSFGSFQDFSPCQRKDSGVTGFEGVTHCLAGFSAQLPKTSDVLVLGAPGSYFLQGQIYSKNLTSAGFIETIENPEIAFDNSYRGFSLALGDFNGDGKEDYVTGTPRGANLMGLVTIFDHQLNELREVQGHQLVSYFGNSVEAVDVNGDGRDDLIVGAPMHTDKGTAIEKWEAGQVYVYLQNADHTLTSPPHLITGQATRARFGYSVSAIGDANQDGYNDIAVGAPFDGEGQSGLVYIFHGSNVGLRPTPSQVLSPSSLGQAGLTTFGFSLQGGQDMDDNSYPDLLVGAENSDTALLVRTRPVVNLQATFTLDPVGINLDNKTVSLPDGSMATGFLVVPCFSYTGNHLPPSIAITYSLQLDSQSSTSSRALFLSNSQSSLSRNRQLSEGNEVCVAEQAYVINSIQDKLSPIFVTLNYELDQDESSLASHQILPILDMNSVSSQIKQVYIQNNCAGNVCTPNLIVSAQPNPRSIIVGGGHDLTLDVTLQNEGEDAFQSTLAVYYPEGLQYVRLERTSQMDLSVACNDNAESRMISCDTGNPLSGRYTLNFGLTLSTSGVVGERESLEFYMIARSENPEDPSDLANNELNGTIDVAVQVSLKLLSASDPETVTYQVNEDGSVPPFPANASDKDIGASIVHLYEVRNSGPSDSGRIEMDIDWPQKNINGEYLFYLLGIGTGDGIDCTVTQGDINPLDVHLDPSTTAQLAGIQTSALRQLVRRDAEAAAVPAVAAAQASPVIYCSGDSCIRIHCTIEQLAFGESQVVRLVGRLWSRTFMQHPEAASQITVVASSASAQVLSIPYNIPYTPGTFSDTTKASTTVSSEELQAPPASIAWWIIVVSVLGGIILLLIIILGLYKCGFFERKKPGEEENKYQQVSAAHTQEKPALDDGHDV